MSGLTIESFADIRPQHLMRIKEGKENGMKVVGIYCTYCPSELILAADAIPVGLCGTNEDPITAAEADLPRNLCPLIKSSYGFAITDTCPFFHFSDLIVGETTCDGKKKMFEIMEKLKPLHVMQLPVMQDKDSSLDLWVEEMYRLRHRLEKELDCTISDEKLRTAIDTVNQVTAAKKAISDLNKMDPPPLRGSDLLTVLWSASFATDQKELVKMLNGLLDTVKHQTVHTGALQPRILLTGCPVGLGTEKVITLVEESGANVVAMENCSGYKTLSLQANATSNDLMRALAEKYLSIPCSCMTPNTHRMELINEMIDEFKIDAVIDLTWQACHTYNIEAYEVQQLVKAKEIPYLHLESDYSSSDLESLKVRIEALLEMVAK